MRKQLEPRDDAPRLTREEHYAYWTERFTMREIRAMAANLDFLSTEQRVVA